MNNKVYQEEKSAISMEKNGRKYCTGSLKKTDASKLINETKQENRRRGGCNMYFCAEFSKIWS